MKTLTDVYVAMVELKKRWVDAEVVDDPEDMWTEIPEFLQEAVPIVELHLSFEKSRQEFFVHGPDGQCGCWPACQRGLLK